MEIIYNFTYIWVIVFGLLIGSFLNVVIYRLPRDIGFVTGRSSCPNCKNQLKWFHNIPVLSYMFLRGKCSFCKKTISFRYPLVEILNACAFFYFFWTFGITSQFWIFCFLTSALLVIFFIDLDFKIIPDAITLPGIVIGLIVSLIPGGIGIVHSLIGVLVGGGALYLVAMLGDWLFKKDSMGGGDIKMAAMLGAFLGWQKVLLVFISSAFIGLFVSLILMAVSSKIRQERVVPFGPFLAMAAMLAILYGDQMIHYYVQNYLTVH